MKIYPLCTNQQHLREFDSSTTMPQKSLDPSLMMLMMRVIVIMIMVLMIIIGVPVLVLTPPSKPHQAIFLAPQALKNLTSPLKQSLDS